ncbi:hypothetical protein PF023_08890 [Enterococcus thailandicus]|uniref:hypothetical protein n=1 Tax=Enterococcus thailandicus TaxID=417368 RepID=UPI0022EBBB55|nr:hypothetical protein [Enterococcus thailandicus]MDA3974159.1 hypothetical protein [Enterococcus thailandicus]MDA3976679.1 hypothetical protein [Enterococcus thailandicus]MDA3981613.1 hypothetical protein [Enterococcus thailandicus]
MISGNLFLIIGVEHFFYNLFLGVPQAASSAISPLFIKIGKTIYRKASLLLEANRLEPQSFIHGIPKAILDIARMQLKIGKAIFNCMRAI